jgi:hypothetical protein
MMVILIGHLTLVGQSDRLMLTPNQVKYVPIGDGNLLVMVNNTGLNQTIDLNIWLRSRTFAQGYQIVLTNTESTEDSDITVNDTRVWVPIGDDPWKNNFSLLSALYYVQNAALTMSQSDRILSAKSEAYADTATLFHWSWEQYCKPMPAAPGGELTGNTICGVHITTVSLEYFWDRVFQNFLRPWPIG